MSRDLPSGIASNRLARQRQISLPLRKAVEIAYKNIRMRFGRSLLVTSGIVLALAFLMSIRTGQAVTGSMRQWIAAAEGSGGAHPLAVGRGFESLRVREQQLQTAVGSSRGRDPAQAAKLQAELMRVREQLSGPSRLKALLAANGIAADPAQNAEAAVQTRWLLGLALLVAFVGILNAMLMSVTERFREIGTMKCLGALDSFIVKLFLIESLFQGIAGTLLGVVVGLGLGIISAVASYGGFVWRDFPTRSIAVSAGLCLVVGVGLAVGGAVYPAWQAAKMHPVEAMRAET